NNEQFDYSDGFVASQSDFSTAIKSYFCFSIISRNSANKGVESWGPGEASGWYCTQKTGFVLWRIPSTVWSLRLIRFTVTSPGKDCGSTANPWFCEVISTRPVARSLTGWLAPRCPNFNLNVRPPNACPKIWCPRQIPKIGTPVFTKSATARTA